MKLSIITRTLRIHDNPFLDSDIYIIYLPSREFGTHQKNFLNCVLNLHVLELKKLGIYPILVQTLTSVSNFIRTRNDIEIYVDNHNPTINWPFKDYKYVATWSLINWSDKIDLITDWFMPEGLKNHNKFKAFAHKNRRDIYLIRLITGTTRVRIRSDYFIDSYSRTHVPLPCNNLDKWIIKKLQSTIFMRSSKWTKPDTSPSISISQDENIPNLAKASKLSPYIALGVLSPVVAYKFYTGENRMGSSRDQLLFREMFHACAQMPQFWNGEFGRKYSWHKKNTRKWNNYINGTTRHEDLDFAMRLLRKEGWLHHLARHMVADYLTLGGLRYDWQLGAQWFKKQLVDHDPAVNRANWMWLSGTAFSTKQRSYFHYSPDNYIKNKNKEICKKILIK